MYSGGLFKAGGPDGHEIEWIELSGHVNASEKIAALLAHLTRDEGIPPEDIAVLVGAPLDHSCFAAATRVGSFPCSRADKPKEGCVIVDSIHRFKGLERAAVILAELDATLENKEVLYVGFSRARLYLAVVGSKQSLRTIKNSCSTANPAN